jgi:PBP1b-binding outer membrane lipoprotein LpoB
MKKIITTIALLALTVLCGCGSSATVKEHLNFGNNASVKYKIADIKTDKVKNPVDGRVKDRIIEPIDKALTRKNMLQTNSSDKAYTVTIDITGYRMKNGALRYFTGAMSGEEFIDSVVTVTDNSGKTVGQANIHTYNLSGFNTMAASHGKEIANFLVKR